MKRILILLLTICSFASFGQILQDPNTTPSTARTNDAISGAYTASGTDTYTISPVGSYSYTWLTGKAVSITFPPAQVNTGSATLNFDGLGAKNIQKYSSGSLTDVVAGDLIGTVRLRYDGTRFVMEGGTGSGGGLSFNDFKPSRTFTSADDLDQTDQFKIVYIGAATAGAFNVTVDALDAGTQVSIINKSAYDITLIVGSGVSSLVGSATIEAGSQALIIWEDPANPDVYSGGSQGLQDVLDVDPDITTSTDIGIATNQKLSIGVEGSTPFVSIDNTTGGETVRMGRVGGASGNEFFESSVGSMGMTVYDGSSNASVLSLSPTEIQLTFPTIGFGTAGDVLTRVGPTGAIWAAPAGGGGSGTVSSGTTGQIAAYTGTTTVGSLTTATYPSLTELSYVKGVTSAIQTQIGTKITSGAGAIVNADVNASAAIAGTKLANTPAGNIAATTVQAAINELDAEKWNVGGTTTLTSANTITTAGNNLTFSGSGLVNHNTGLYSTEPNSSSTNRGFSLSTRDVATLTFPVPSVRPTITNSVIAFDIMPNGSPTENGNGFAWIDVCDTDLLNSNGAASTLRLAMTSSGAVVGSRSLNGATALPLLFKTDIATVMTTGMTLTAAGKLMLGTKTGTANYNLDIHQASAAANVMQFTNTNTGSVNTDGLNVGIDATGNALILQRENLGIQFHTNATQKVNISGSGTTFFGGSTTATALVHIAAGTTAASTAPLKFTSGPLNTTAEAGAVEFLTDKLYGTITTGAARKELTLNDAALTSGRVPIVTTNGRLTDDANLTYGSSTLTAPTIAATTAVTAPTVTTTTAVGSAARTASISGNTTHKTYELPWIDAAGTSVTQDINILNGYTDATATIRYTVAAIKSDGSVSIAGEYATAFNKDGGTTVVQVGSTHVIWEEKPGAASFTTSVASNLIRVVVDSGSADSYRWTVFAKVTITQL